MTIAPETTTLDIADPIALHQQISDLNRRLAESWQANQQLQKQLSMFSQTLDMLDDMVLIKGPKSQIVYANQAFRTLYGMSQEQIQGLIDAPFNEPDYTQQYIHDDEQVFTTGQRLVIPQEPVTRYDGAVRIVRTVKSPIFNADGQVTHTAGIMQDTTDHAQAEAKLQIFAEVVNTMQYGLYIWRLEQIDDPATLTAVAANPAAQRFTGVELRDHIGKKIGDVFQGINDTTSIPVAYAEIIRSGQARNLGEIAYDDGIISSVFATQGFPLPNNCIAIIFEDITERKRAEETMRQGMIQEEKIRAQQTALEELSTPLIPITDQIVVMPLIGALDSRRAQQVVGALLHGVSETRARTAILDITGVSVVDTQVANALIRAAQSAQLLGAQVMITGIRPEVAQTLIGLGVDLRGIITHSSLQSAIASAMARN